VGIEEIEGDSPKVVTADGAVERESSSAADGLHSRLRREAGLASGKPSDRYGVTAHVTPRRPVSNVVDIFIERGYELYVTPVTERASTSRCSSSRRRCEGSRAIHRTAFATSSRRTRSSVTASNSMIGHLVPGRSRALRPAAGRAGSSSPAMRRAFSTD